MQGELLCSWVKVHLWNLAAANWSSHTKSSRSQCRGKEWMLDYRPTTSRENPPLDGCCSTSELAAIGFASCSATEEDASTECSVEECCCGASLEARRACGSGPAVVASPITVVCNNDTCALGSNAMGGTETWCCGCCGCGGAWGRCNEPLSRVVVVEPECGDKTAVPATV
jgi:hypothetical protein